MFLCECPFGDRGQAAHGAIDCIHLSIFCTSWYTEPMHIQGNGFLVCWDQGSFAIHSFFFFLLLFDVMLCYKDALDPDMSGVMRNQPLYT